MCLSTVINLINLILLRGKFILASVSSRISQFTLSKAALMSRNIPKTCCFFIIPSSIFIIILLRLYTITLFRILIDILEDGYFLQHTIADNFLLKLGIVCKHEVRLMGL